MTKVINIEALTLCNNRCEHCYQTGLRKKGYFKNLTFDEVIEKLRQGIKQGGTGVNFSGGEPTIRKDFLLLLKHAKLEGYREISVTSNGRMFSYKKFLQKAVQLGLKNFGITLLGTKASVHDELTGVGGSFDQTVTALSNIAQLKERYGLKLSIFFLITKKNISELNELENFVIRFKPDNLVLQPFILNPDLIGRKEEFSVSINEVKDAILNANFRKLRIKLYNIPYCAVNFRGVEIPEYTVKIFREFESSENNKKSGRELSFGFVLLDDCATCEYRRVCPGLHSSLIPEDFFKEKLLDEIKKVKSEEAWISGLDFFSKKNQQEIAENLKDIKNLHIFTGGNIYKQALNSLRPFELIFVIKPDEAYINFGNLYLFDEFYKSVSKNLSVFIGVDFFTEENMNLIYEKLKNAKLNKIYLGLGIGEGNREKRERAFFLFSKSGIEVLILKNIYDNEMVSVGGISGKDVRSGVIRNFFMNPTAGIFDFSIPEIFYPVVYNGEHNPPRIVGVKKEVIKRFF